MNSISQHIQPGERVTWTGVPSTFGISAALSAAFLLALTVIGPAAYFGAPLWQMAPHHSLPTEALLVLAALVLGCAVATGMWPITWYRRRQSTHYVVTDRRLLQVYDDRTMTTASYAPHAIMRFVRSVDRKGGPRLIVEFSSSAMDWTGKMWIVTDDVEAAETAIRDMAVSAGINI